MSLATNVSNFATRVATEIKAVSGRVGVLSNLTTTDKSSVVSAINEVKTAVGGAGAQINDAATNTSTTWSGSKTNTSIVNASAALKADLLGGAGATIDTLKEIADLVTSTDAENDGIIAGLTTAVGNRVRFDAAQTLTAGQKTQAQSNMGVTSSTDIGDPNTNFVTTFEAGLV